MSNCSRVLIITALLSAGTACDSGRYSSAGFRLPPNADGERGKRAFVELGCPSCHRVSGMDLPSPTVQPAVPVVLGGEVDKKLSDAYLLTAMIYPSHQLAPAPKDQIATGGVSRMPDFTDKMTVRQAVDVVGFLQSRYTVRQTLPNYAYR
jgi:L-cysteine S-thiosulfotransferase